MIRVGIVDDEAAACEQLREAVSRFSAENEIEFDIRTYASAPDYLAKKDPRPDILYLDIDMPGMSGMELAETIRLTDSDMVIIFCTNLEQFALSGYRVSALGFLVKPVDWYPFQLFLRRALNAVALRSQLAAGGMGKKIVLKDGSSSRLVEVSSVEYVEVRKHDLLYMVRDRSTGCRSALRARGSMRDAAKELAPYGFARCAASYLVNLRSVNAVNGMDVHLGETVLHIGRAFKDSFRREFARHLATREWEALPQ